MDDNLVLLVRQKRVGGTESQPLFASDDPELLAAVGRAIARRMGAGRKPAETERPAPRRTSRGSKAARP